MFLYFLTIDDGVVCFVVVLVPKKTIIKVFYKKKVVF